MHKCTVVVRRSTFDLFGEGGLEECLEGLTQELVIPGRGANSHVATDLQLGDEARGAEPSDGRAVALGDAEIDTAVALLAGQRLTQLASVGLQLHCAVVWGLDVPVDRLQRLWQTSLKDWNRQRNRKRRAVLQILTACQHREMTGFQIYSVHVNLYCIHVHYLQALYTKLK